MRLFKTLFVFLFAQCTAQSQEERFQHSFAGGKPLPAQLRMIGPNAEEAIRPVAAGLRISPAPSNKQTLGWGVAANFRLSGDFEVTAGYELLTAEKPTKGAGSGVAINVVLDEARNKFAKVGRFVLADGRHVYIAESWTKNNSPSDHRSQTQVTASRAGRLRLRREGAVLLFQVADSPDGAFQTLQKVEFGTEDLATARFVANPNGSATRLEAILTDFGIVTQNPVGAEASGLLPAIEPRKTKFALILIGVLLAALALAGGAMYAMARRRRTGEQPSSPG